MNISGDLSLEQKFKMQVFREQVKHLSQEEAQQYLLEVLRQGMVKDNLLRNWIKKS
ncbi:MAG: phycobilisome degradation protein nblA [Oscillatoriales cyanobacterium RM2_1_1]|nr:phycobilisome degradation protein nblA [Oscillatoriales cyanobacterium SM2_3_0]NJO44571.1 phycobilisome degradation protein nblA [Oscillatoriales cyanobacterium RM2_1_1]